MTSQPFAVLHDEADHAVARAAHREAAEELVAKGLGLGHGAARAVVNALGEELDAVLGKAEALLHHGGELTNAAALLSQPLTGARCLNDNLRANRCHANLDACVAVFRKGALEELVELGEENAVSDEL